MSLARTRFARALCFIPMVVAFSVINQGVQIEAEKLYVLGRVFYGFRQLWQHFGFCGIPGLINSSFSAEVFLELDFHCEDLKFWNFTAIAGTAYIVVGSCLVL